MFMNDNSTTKNSVNTLNDSLLLIAQKVVIEDQIKKKKKQVTSRLFFNNSCFDSSLFFIKSLKNKNEVDKKFTIHRKRPWLSIIKQLTKIVMSY